MDVKLNIDPAKVPPPGDEATAQRHMPDLLQELSAAQLPETDALLAAMGQNPDLHRLIFSILANSPFLTQSIFREPASLAQIVTAGPEDVCAEAIKTARALAISTDSEAATMKSLRVAKRHLALATAVADIAGHWPLYKVTGALSDFADAAADAACAHVICKAAERGAFRLKTPDYPCVDSGFLVLGMGKLGARELNYSSDIDLICLFDPERIETEDRDKLQTHAIRMTRTLAKILDERTVDGYVFRVDLRLRPDPGSTPLAISTLAAEAYYESLGQNWERAAMIKARPIAGDLEAGAAFLHMLRPFVWRKSLDFAAIQDIQSIKRQIHAHKGGGEIAVNGHDIKIGRGGIREIEFFAQTQQLIWGGREPSAREPRTIDAIRALVDLGQVETCVAGDLNDAYEFLRRLEHRLQMENDEQTQTLPQDDEGIHRIAAFMGYAAAKDFRSALMKVLDTVQQHYGNLFGAEPSLGAGNGAEGNLAFTGAASDPETLSTLKRLGFVDPAKVDHAIRAWHHGRVRATRSTRAREILTELTPALLAKIAEQPDPDATFIRFDAFLTSLPSGVQLFSMFQAYPQLLALLAEVMGEAPRLANHLSHRPTLLDSVLSADFYDPLPGAESLCDDCVEALTDVRFYEDILDAVRRWNDDRRFQVGIQLLRGVISPGQAARHFSDIADATLQTLFPHVIAEYQNIHGKIDGSSMSVLALGKLGSRELTPSSDLDLIFVYDCPDIEMRSDGERPLAAQQYFTRLGQRMISAVMSMTAEGKLYELDMRLRPSGNKGPVASAIEGFRRYYHESAWVWEFMALVRARVVFDFGGGRQGLESVIRDALTRARDKAETAAAVASMRGRIERQRNTSCIWNIKQVPGGQVDVDFIAQYLVLANAHEHEDIMSADSIDVFRRAADLQLIDKADAETLAAAKELFRDIQTFLSLTIEGDLTDAAANAFTAPLRDDLVQITASQDFDALAAALDATQKDVRRLFIHLIGDPDTHDLQAKDV